MSFSELECPGCGKAHIGIDEVKVGREGQKPFVQTILRLAGLECFAMVATKRGGGSRAVARGTESGAQISMRKDSVQSP